MRMRVLALVAAVSWVSPLWAQDRVQDAYAAYRTGEYDAAVSLLGEELRRRPEPDAAVLLARVLRETGRYGEAEELVRRTLARHPERSELEQELGEVLLATGRDPEALAAFDRAAKAGGSGTLGALVRVGEITLAQGDGARADRIFGAVVAAYNRGDVETSADLAAVATALVHLGRWDYSRLRDALRLYDQAIAADSTNLDALAALGELFLSKYNGTDALESFTIVLARNPNHPSALLGMARVRRFDGAVDAFDLTEESLEANPNLVPARVLAARQYLDLEDYDRADREARRALEIDAGDPQARTMLAASALVRGDSGAFHDRLASVRRLWPHDPAIFVTLAEVAARNRLYHHAVAFGDSALTVDSLSWRGYALRGINRLRTGDMDGGRADLDVAFAGDPFDVWTKNTLDLLDDLATYTVIVTDRYHLAIPADEAGLLRLYLAPLAEAAWDSLSAHYGTSPTAPVRIEMFPESKDFSVRTIGLVGMGALGVSFGPVIAMDAPSARPPGAFHWGTTLWHEIAHSFHMQASDNRVPRWFTEGLAVFEERRARPGWGDRIEWEFLLAYLDDRLAPIEDLNQGFMRPAYPQQIAFSYYQSSLVFDFIDERWGFPAIVELLRGYGEGRTTGESFVAVLDMDLTAFAEAYDAYFQERFAGPLAALEPSADARQPTTDDVRERAAADSTDFLAHLSLGMHLLNADPDSALPHLERAKALFPEYAGGDSPYWLLAVAHHRAGRSGKVLVELEALTSRNRAHYPGLRLLAEVSEAVLDTGTAIGAVRDLQYVYPYEEDEHRRLAEWYGATGQLALAVREREALLAMDPFNRAEALYRLAEAQFTAGDRRAARSTVLQALEQAPNYEEALELLLRIRGDAP